MPPNYHSSDGKKEAIPITQTKNSLITRFLTLFSIKLLLFLKHFLFLIRLYLFVYNFMFQINQKTLNGEIKLSGVGLHNGKEADLIIKPAKENFGIQFWQVDLDKENLIQANFKNVVEPILCTKIKNDKGLTISTVEHLMAAFFGEGIDNALVEID